MAKKTGLLATVQAPDGAVGRIVLHSNRLAGVSEETGRLTNSHETGGLCGGTSAQVRRDLMLAGATGISDRGYEGGPFAVNRRVPVRAAPAKVLLVGVKNLGRAVSRRSSLLVMVAAFDSDPAEAGPVSMGCRCHAVTGLGGVEAIPQPILAPAGCEPAMLRRTSSTYFSRVRGVRPPAAHAVARPPRVALARSASRRAFGPPLRGPRFGLGPTERFLDSLPVDSQAIPAGMLSVPVAGAQEVAEGMIASGIRGILEFAPVTLRVPHTAYVDDIDQAMALEKVASFARHGQQVERKHV